MTYAGLGVVLVVACVLVGVVADEEPLADMTDLNVAHVLGLSLAILSVFFDNVAKLSCGAAASLDAAALRYGAFYAYALGAYVCLIWVVFFLHTVAPLSADVSAGAAGVGFGECWAALGGGVCVVGLVGVALWALLRGVGALGRARALVGAVTLLALDLVAVCELVARALSSSAHTPATVPGMGRSSHAKVGDAAAGGAGFEWHEAHVRPFTSLGVDTMTLFAAAVGVLLALVAGAVAVVAAGGRAPARAGLLAWVRAVVEALGAVVVGVVCVVCGFWVRGGCAVWFAA